MGAQGSDAGGLCPTTGAPPLHPRLPFFVLAQESAPVELVTNQLLLLATIVGSIAALPALIQFLLDWRKRRERLDLAIDDAASPPRSQPVHIVGIDALLADIADLVDRAAHPEEYRGLTLGNELLIVGPEQGGRKLLARWIAQQAGIPRVVTLHNPRSPDALAATKKLVRNAGRDKLMLLLPNIDDVFDEPAPEQDEEVQAELDALVETLAQSSSVLVIGTATSLAEGDDLDNLFGMKIMLPGAPPVEARAASKRPAPGSEHAMFLEAVAMDALAQMEREGFRLESLSSADAAAMLLRRVANPAEIEDAVEAAQTTALYLQRSGKAASPAITPAVFEKGIRRVMGA